MKIENKFEHKEEEVISGYEPQQPKGDAKVGVKEKYAKFVPGYQICDICGQHPAYAFDSAKPREVKVITCEHITERVDQ